MKVRCIDNSEWELELKIGQIYTVERKIGGDRNGRFKGPRYILKDSDYSAPGGIFIERFEIVPCCPCDINSCLKHRTLR